MKLTYIIQVYKSMFPMKKGTYRINILFIDLHKIFPLHCDEWEGFLKRILMYLYCTKCNGINIYHSDVQNDVSYKTKKKDT